MGNRLIVGDVLEGGHSLHVDVQSEWLKHDRCLDLRPETLALSLFILSCSQQDQDEGLPGQDSGIPQGHLPASAWPEALYRCPSPNACPVPPPRLPSRSLSPRSPPPSPSPPRTLSPSIQTPSAQTVLPLPSSLPCSLTLLHFNSLCNNIPVFCAYCLYVFIPCRVTEREQFLQLFSKNK